MMLYDVMMHSSKQKICEVDLHISIFDSIDINNYQQH